MHIYTYIVLGRVPSKPHCELAFLIEKGVVLRGAFRHRRGIGDRRRTGHQTHLQTGLTASVCPHKKFNCTFTRAGFPPQQQPEEYPTGRAHWIRQTGRDL